MNLRAKIYVENQKKNFQARLDVRLASLKEKGLEESAIKKDPTVRKLKAEVRHSDFRLASIAAQEKLTRDLAQAKLDRIAAEKTALEEAQKGPAEKGPEKKEKKAKKEKPEKQAKPEGKKEKAEGKKEKSEGKSEGKKEKAEKAEKTEA